MNVNYGSDNELTNFREICMGKIPRGLLWYRKLKEKNKIIGLDIHFLFDFDNMEKILLTINLN
jgi:hypothetical protein